MPRRPVVLFVLAISWLALGVLPSEPHSGHAVAGERLSRDAALHGGEEGCLYHWPKLPVRIHIVANSADEREWAHVAAAGFDEWVRATRGVVSYQLVGLPEQAQITVRFVPASVIPDRPSLVGLTTTYWIGPVLQSADVVLAAGQKSPGELQTAAAHELGHALGIRGHSDDPDDLMFPAPLHAHVPAAHPVTDHDLNTLKRCYPSLFVL